MMNVVLCLHNLLPYSWYPNSVLGRDLDPPCPIWSWISPVEPNSVYLLRWYSLESKETTMKTHESCRRFKQCESYHPNRVKLLCKLCIKSAVHSNWYEDWANEVWNRCPPGNTWKSNHQLCSQCHNQSSVAPWRQEIPAQDIHAVIQDAANKTECHRPMRPA